MAADCIHVRQCSPHITYYFRSICASSSKVRKIKTAKCIGKEYITDANKSCTQEKYKSKKLLSVSQPILKKDLKNKLHVLLANWKPPLKKKILQEKQEVSKIDSEKQDNSTKREKCGITLAEMTETAARLSQSNSQNHLIQTNADANEMQIDNSSNYNDNKTVINNLECKTQFSEHTTYDVSESVSSVEQRSPIPTNCDSIQTLNLAENASEKCVLEKEDKANETILQVNNDLKSQVVSPNEIINTDSPETRTGYLTPEFAGTPPTPPTLKVAWLNRNTLHKLSPNVTENIQHKEDSHEPSNTYNPMSNEGKTHFGSDSLKIEEENSNSTTTIKAEELKSKIKHSAANTTNTECDLDDLKISHSQLESIENNLPSLIIQTEPEQNFNCLNFTPFHPTLFTPKMPQMDWIRQLQEDKKRLQAAVRDISQLNALLTRAIREVWPAKK